MAAKTVKSDASPTYFEFSDTLKYIGNELVGSALRTRLLKGIGATAFGQVVNVAVQLFGVPIFLAIWSMEKYGEWLALTSLASVLSMSQIGFASAAANDMTMSVGRRDYQHTKVIYQSVWVLLTALSVAVLIAALVIMWCTSLCEWLPLRTLTPEQGATVLSLLAIYILIGFQGDVLGAGFRCDGHYAVNTLCVTVERTIEFAAQIATLIASQSMIAVAAAGLSVRCVGLIAKLLLLRSLSPWLVLGLQYAHLRTIRRLVAPAAMFAGFSLGDALSVHGVIQVIALFLGPAAVTVFVAHRTFCNSVTQVVKTINQAMWPEFSTAYGAGNLALTRDLHRRACQWSIWLAAASSIGLALASSSLFHIWTSGAVSVDFGLLLVLLFTGLVRSIWITSCTISLAVNKHERIVLVYLLATATSIGLAPCFSLAWGLTGTAIPLALTDVGIGLYIIRTSLSLVVDSWRPFAMGVVMPPLWSTGRWPQIASAFSTTATPCARADDQSLPANGE